MKESVPHLVQINESNVVYSFGIVMLDVLLGERIVSEHIRCYYERNNWNEDFVMNIPPNVNHCPEVFSIVEKCLSHISSRPTIHEIRNLLRHLEGLQLHSIPFSNNPPIMFSVDSFNM